MSKNPRIFFCYLCGLPIESNLSKDHVPPRQFFAESIRKIDHSLKLLTLPTHQSCNKSYQADEDYFVASIGPMAMRHSIAGLELWKDLTKRMQRPKSFGLKNLIEREFSNKHGRLYLPPGRVNNNFNLQRVRSVIWKITRGLFTHETNRFLPENTPMFFKYQSDIGKGTPPEEFFELVGTPVKGNHKGIFAYRYLVDAELNGFNIWSMLFWDAWIVVVGFHDPNCPCDICLKSKSK